MMNTREDYVRKFHEAFGLAMDVEPTMKLINLRKTLITEETKELIDEMDKAIQSLEKGEQVSKELWADMLKELADVQTVLSGASVSLKPLRNLEEAFIRVHESNMSKLGEDGKPIHREDGKVLKGPNYFKPDLSDLV